MTSEAPSREDACRRQQEKFLFYRGVSTFPVPISAKLTTAGKLLVENGSEEEIPHTILFERRGEKVAIASAERCRRTILDAPELTGTSMNWAEISKEAS